MAASMKVFTGLGATRYKGAVRPSMEALVSSPGSPNVWSPWMWVINMACNCITE